MVCFGVFFNHNNFVCIVYKMSSYPPPKNAGSGIYNASSFFGVNDIGGATKLVLDLATSKHVSIWISLIKSIIVLDADEWLSSTQHSSKINWWFWPDWRTRHRRNRTWAHRSNRRWRRKRQIGNQRRLFWRPKDARSSEKESVNRAQKQSNWFRKDIVCVRKRRWRSTEANHFDDKEHSN